MSEADTAEDDELMRRAGRGDAVAFSHLVARHGRRAGGLAARFLGTRGEAEEIVQEAFTRLWIKSPDWTPDGAQVSTWLHRVVVNLCLDRKRRPAPAPIEAAAEVPDPAPRSDEIVLAAERSRRVQDAVAALPERQRAALLLCHFEEMSNIDAAAVLEISIGALESLLMRARRTLRETLNDLAPPSNQETTA